MLEGGPGGRDVATDVRGLPAQLRRIDAQGLIEGRVDEADEDVHQDPQGHCDGGQHPPLLPDVVEEQARGDDGDGDEQGEGRFVGVDAGGGGAVDDVVPGEHQFEPLEVVVDGFDERQDPEDDREVGLDRGRDAPLRPLHMDAADVVDRQAGSRGRAYGIRSRSMRLGSRPPVGPRDGADGEITNAVCQRGDRLSAHRGKR